MAQQALWSLTDLLSPLSFTVALKTNSPTITVAMETSILALKRQNRFRVPPNPQPQRIFTAWPDTSLETPIHRASVCVSLSQLPFTELVCMSLSPPLMLRANSVPPAPLPHNPHPGAWPSMHTVLQQRLASLIGGTRLMKSLSSYWLTNRQTWNINFCGKTQQRTRGTIDQCNRIESQLNPRIFGQLIFWIVPKHSNREKNSLFNKWCPGEVKITLTTFYNEEQASSIVVCTFCQISLHIKYHFKTHRIQWKNWMSTCKRIQLDPLLSTHNVRILTQNESQSCPGW